MNKFRYLILILVAALPLALSCSDEGPNSPGGEGAEETGVVMDVDIIMDTPDIDAYQIRDFDGDPLTVDPEPFFSDYGVAQVDAQYISGNTASQETYKMYITRYTMEYSSDVKDSPPLKKRTIYKTVKIDPKNDSRGFAEFELDIVDLPTKEEFRDFVAGGNFDPGVDPVRYTITYTFYGKDQYGNSFTAVSSTPIKIGHFNNC